MVKTLYVGNLPWAATEEEIKSMFSDHGNVLDCRIITERATGRSKGYGFVEVQEEDVDPIISALDGKEIEGRKIVVNEAKPRDN
jgi:RNA recognition motif-containing protein